MMNRFVTAAAVALGLVSCGGPEQLSESLESGKAEAADARCRLDGRFAVFGTFPSFSKWVFSFHDGELTDSFTDDLSAEEWPTTVAFDPHDSQNVSLVQITHASDALITTTLYLKRTCRGSTAVLSPVVAQTAFFDMTSSEHSIEGHVVRSGAACDSFVAFCRSECVEAMAAGDDYLCFEECMDVNAWPCPKLCVDGTSRGIHDCPSLQPLST